MDRITTNLTRRQFLARAGAGVTAAILAPGMLAAAGRNVAPAPAGNPLFTGELGIYEGVTLHFDPPAHQQAMVEAVSKGKGLVMYKGSGKTSWIPMDEFYRRGWPASKRRG